VPSSERLVRRLAGAAWLAATTGALLGYPHLIEHALARFGVRPVCAALLLFGAASFVLGARARATLGVVAWPGLGIAAVLAFGLATGERRALGLVPAFVYLGLAASFRASLADGGSLIERGARWLVPQTPDFVRGYCRKLTAFWVVFFAVCSLVIAMLALGGSAAAWRAVTGGWIYAAMLAISAVEFFVRKTWFRYYFHGGPFDRLWARLFPAENTEQGRRSAAYIQRYRDELAGDARARG